MEHSNLWSMNSAGWKPDPSETCTTFVPCDVDGALTISSAYKHAGVISDEENAEMAQKGAPLYAERIPITCGAFVGLTTEYDEEAEEGKFYLRVWWLYSERVHLYITYNCDPEHKDVHRGVIDWMLGTLRNRARSESLVHGTDHKI